MKFLRTLPPALPRCLAAITLLALLVTTSEAWARAGDGGGYGGGGGGGGGGFSGGGGGGSGGSSGDGELVGYLIYLLFQLCIHYPMIGLPIVTAIVVGFFYFGKQANSAHQGRTIRRAAPVLTAQRRAEAVAKLQTHDPQFDETAFYERVTAAFLKIQHAWSQQDLTDVRPFVSDGIHERFALQIAEQRQRDFRNAMEDVQVSQVTLAEVHANPVFDVVTLRIAASAVDYRVALSDGRHLQGSQSSEPFVEYWSLLRRRGVMTQPDQPGLFEGICPNCGTSLHMNQSAQCSACDSLLRSGRYDWVLSEITQECEWRSTANDLTPGLEAYRTGHDAGVNVQQLEDRASVIFWRKAAADQQSRLAPLEKVASDEFCAAYEPRLRADEHGVHHFFGDCAVGSVEVRGLLPAEQLETNDGLDRALVEVRWSGKRFQRPPTGQLVVDNYARLSRSLFILGRQAGVTTNVDNSVASAHCPGCGAPESEEAAHACSFCGIVLNNGQRDWVLLDIQPVTTQTAEHWLQIARAQASVATSPTAQDEVIASAPAPGGVALLAWLIKSGLADKTIDAQERKMLTQVAARHHLPEGKLDTLILAAEQGQLDCQLPADPTQAREWLTTAADLSLADGRIHRAEYDLLCEAGSPLGLSPADVKLLLRRRKTELYRAARATLKQPRAAARE